MSTLDTVSTLRRQLSLGKFLRYLPVEGTRRFLNGLAVTSYAQNGEDLMILSLLEWPRTGFYVDVGCHHPIRLSNTYALYLRGLTGLAIDANDEFDSAFKSYRPRDRFVRACVGNEAGFVDFTIYKERALSSASTKKVEGVSEAQYAIERVESLPVRRIDDILQEAGAPRQFELLSIDVENHDFSALQSIDLKTYEPRLIVVEAHDVDVNSIGTHEVSIYLKAFGYEAVACQRSNILFLRRPR